MKYIRTKDGIFEKTEWQCDLSGEMFLVKANNKFGNESVFVDEILKQADTIEELCDEFVIYQLWTKSYYIGTKAVGSIKSNIESKYYLSMGYENPVVYGAIWVENKGLIFVARMNNEGVMELL